MNYLILGLIIILSIEIIIRTKYMNLVNSLFKSIIKAKKIILNKNVSDHWKEKVVPKYSLKMLKISFSMLIVFFMIFALFFLASLFFSEFTIFIFSLRGILISILFGFIYLYFKKIF